jgi:ubiquinone/menaquinone biosynthesis C-methylase UbiE
VIIENDGSIAIETIVKNLSDKLKESRRSSDMKTQWDYTKLADAYLKRPNYSSEAIDQMLTIMNLPHGAKVCDVGAGVAHLTIELAKRKFDVTAIEPNDAMRSNGMKKTASMTNVRWFEGTGEETGQPDETFYLVTFGSSFNVTDRPTALRETNRILKSRGWFACMWNHRDLEDPLQKEIERIITYYIPNYNYGTRREDQTDIINASGLFSEVKYLEGNVIHTQTTTDCVEAWRSHATLHRQAGSKFEEIIQDIRRLLSSMETVRIPYTTRIWIAQTIK